MERLKNWSIKALRSLEKYTKTDMVYLIQNSFWVNANTVITSFFSFLLSVSFAHYVSKDTYGTYQFLISISSIIGGLTLIGMNNAVTQAVARGFDGVLKESLKTQIKFGVISFIFGASISLYYLINDNGTLAFSILIISIFLPVTNALNTWTAFLSGKKDFKYLFIFSQIINITYYIGLITTIFIVPKVIPLIFIGFILNLISNYIAYNLVIKKYNPSEESEDSAISYGKKLSFSSILPMIALNIDNIIVFHFLGPIQLAIYAFASNIPERLGGLIKPISSVAFPKLSTKSASQISNALPEKIVRLFIFSMLFSLFYYFISPFLFKIFFPQYLDSIVYSQVYALAVAFSITASLPITSMYAIRSKYIYTLNAAYPIVSIGLVLILTYYFGIWGVVFAKVLSNVVLFCLSYLLMRRHQD